MGRALAAAAWRAVSLVHHARAGQRHGDSATCPTAASAAAGGATDRGGNTHPTHACAGGGSGATPLPPGFAMRCVRQRHSPPPPHHAHTAPTALAARHRTTRTTCASTTSCSCGLPRHTHSPIDRQPTHLPYSRGAGYVVARAVCVCTRMYRYDACTRVVVGSRTCLWVAVVQAGVACRGLGARGGWR